MWGATVGGGPTTVEGVRRDLLRRLAVNDPAALESVLGPPARSATERDERPAALVRIAALAALEAAPASYQWAVAQAFAAGIAEHEIIGVLVDVAPIVGSARVSGAASALAGVLGCEPEPI